MMKRAALSARHFLLSVKLYKKTSARLNKVERRGAVVFYLGIPAHRNLGDLAQGVCIRRWLKKHYPEHQIIEIETNALVNTPFSLLNIAHDLPITVNDPSVELELLFIDDLVEELFDALEGREHRCVFDGVNTVLTEGGRYCAAPMTHRATLGYIVECLHRFHDQPKTLVIPEIPNGSFTELLKIENAVRSA